MLESKEQIYLQANSEAIYARMQTERQREAKEFRAQGAEIATKLNLQPIKM